MKDGVKLITTKLKAPAPRKNYVRREALFDKLELVPERKVTVVQGAAGSGKTTLITSYMKEHPELTFRWIALDADNNDLFSFWFYLLEAIKADLGGHVDDLYSIFDALPQKHEMDNLLILLVNQLAAAEGFTLVLDDFHTMEDPDLLRTFEFFIKYCPESVRFVLLTREAPKLYLGEWMVSGQYLEIGEQDLKFSASEAAQFLQDTLGAQVDEETASRLNELTEGWAGGLQLMALAQTHQKALPLSETKGLNKYMINYLSNEILSSVSPEEKQFLIRTSILNYFNESICNRLLNKEASQSLINSLSDKNMFIVTIDEDEGVYRYHHLFGEFLRWKFSEWDDESKREWHGQAAAIYEQVGDLEESVKHYFQAGFYREALLVIVKMRHTVTGWTYLRQVPLEYLVDSRDLVFQRLFYHFCNLEFEVCRQILDDVSARVEEDAFWNILQFTRFFMDEGLHDLEIDPGTTDEIERMDLSDVTKAIIYLTSSMLLGLRDQYAEALECINKAIRLESRFHNPYIRYFALTCQSQLLESLGELNQCQRVYESLSRLLENHRYLAPLSANSLIGEAGIYMKMMRLDKAEQLFEQARLKLPTEYLSMERGYIHNRMEMCLLQKDKPGAAQWMKRLTSFQILYQHPLYHSALLKYQMLAGEVEPDLLRSFIEWMEHGQDTCTPRYDDQLVYVRILFRRGDKEQALACLEDLLKNVRKHKIKFILIEAILLKVAILDADGTGSERELLNLAREAIHYSFANGIASPYVLEGDTVRKALIVFMREREKDLLPKEKQFVHFVLSLWSQDKPEESLSERELEVLRVLSTGLSNKEIGERLCISVATVKTHIIKIYAKLHVSNRMEAVEKGRQLGLLQ
ncbi:LuxR C-terminal-related transcriptional regulator [Paenibacillus sp. J2TS4]|uniref:LuxR C-terminal-related transcriptional regulator n=1 Tax=Paenibacillus sp. J2TS4 TaxID=2807194 RepID=UPI001B205F83|nr:LuxR C-terminal-related transcriptional regulator [Paenibacillus sp. J2TS4]GIP33195.1 helix-turn-helix transcriptional regulator [Paenibacillus sp. J2TS4]